jgi:hypothetical protein
MGTIFSPYTYPNRVNTQRVSGRGYPLPSLNGTSSVSNIADVSSYLYAQHAPNWGAPSIIDCCYSSKGKVFFQTFGLRPSSMSQSEFVILNKLILRGATVGGLRPPKVLKNVI